jgi:hypothetical protein
MTSNPWGRPFSTQLLDRFPAQVGDERRHRTADAPTLFATRRPSWFTLRRLVLVRWPSPLAQPAVLWLDKSLYLPREMGK